MTAGDLVIEAVSHGELPAFAREVAADAGRFRLAPVTLIRAKAHHRNPCADPEDTALLVAYIERRCVGYHALIPGLLTLEGRDHKMLWGSTFYVDPATRGRGVGRSLVAAIQAMGMDTVVTEITPPAIRLFVNCGFVEIGEGRFCSLRPERVLRDEQLMQDGIPTAVYAEAKRSCYRRALAHMAADRCEERVVDKMAVEAGEDAAAGAAPFFRRGPGVVNWMLHNPWFHVLERGPVPPSEKGLDRFYFTGVRRSFTFKALAYDGEKGPGHLVLSVSRHKHRRSVKALDHHLPDADHRRAAVYSLLTRAAAEAADRVDCPACLLPAMEAFPLLAPMVKKKGRRYWAHLAASDSPLARAVAKGLRFSISDGDTPFS